MCGGIFVRAISSLKSRGYVFPPPSAGMYTPVFNERNWQRTISVFKFLQDLATASALISFGYVIDAHFTLMMRNITWEAFLLKVTHTREM